MRIGMTQGTATCGGEDYLGCIARLGLSAAEPFIGSGSDERLYWSDAEIDQFVSRAGSLGVLVPSVAVGLFNTDSAIVDRAKREKAIDLTRRALEFSAAVGAEVMLLCTYLASHPDNPEKKAVLLEVIHEVEPVARRGGVAIALESPLPAEELAQLADATASDVVGVYYDFGNAVFLGFDPAHEIETLGARILGVHVKDSGDKLGSLHLGQGKLDLAPAMEAIKRIGYGGWLMLETPPDDEAAVRVDMDVLKQHL